MYNYNTTRTVLGLFYTGTFNDSVFDFISVLRLTCINDDMWSVSQATAVRESVVWAVWCDVSRAVCVRPAVCRVW